MTNSMESEIPPIPRSVSGSEGTQRGRSPRPACRATTFTQVEFAMLFIELQAVPGFPFSAKRGRWPKAGWGAESRYGTLHVRADGRAIRLGLKQRATPHPALRATFPSELGKVARG